MSEIAVRVENITKRYSIGPDRPLRTLRDALTGNIGRLGRRQIPPRTDQDFWALGGVSFEVKRGEVLGVIGSNGAGKSTLLKILARVTVPTSGTMDMWGRVGSLLEVGTGFHGELSGRDNIYLNGAILGMRRSEIKRRFDDIVAFAEVERFIDTPVKHYSSGMYMRLAFAVAAHLDPEILLIDEVLSVGDAQFQAKCLGKVGEVAKQGRTVLFVSHNAATVQHLCERVLLLRSGMISADGSPETALAEYLSGNVQDQLSTGDLSRLPRGPDHQAILRRIEFFDPEYRPVDAVPAGAPLMIRLHYSHADTLADPFFGLTIESTAAVKLFGVNTRVNHGLLDSLPRAGYIDCYLPTLPLTPSVYYVSAACGSGQRQLDLVERAIRLQVVEADVFGTGRLPHASTPVLVQAIWQPSKTDQPERANGAVHARLAALSE